MTVPILFYDLRPHPLWSGTVAITDPCPYCGRRHTHGPEDGHRAAHCGPHTHDLTPTGRRRSIYANGVTVCDHCQDEGYILQKRPTPWPATAPGTFPEKSGGVNADDRT